MASVSEIKSSSIDNLPSDIVYAMSNFLGVRDLLSCCCVSKKWQTLFSSDAAWGFLAKEYKVTQLNSDFLSKGALYISQFGPKRLHTWVKSHVTTDLKIQVLNKVRQEMQKKWASEFLLVFESAAAIERLPTIKRVQGQQLKTEDFSSPIVKCEYNNGRQIEFNFILFRIRNNNSEKILHEAVGFHTLNKRYFFAIKFENSSTTIRGNHNEVTPLKLDRLKRLIKHQPVGELIEDKDFSLVTEGPRMTSDGKNTLELV